MNPLKTDFSKPPPYYILQHLALYLGLVLFMSVGVVMANSHLSEGAGSDDFITTWTTTSASKEITFPGSGTYTIDWGDGTEVTSATGTATHAYASRGTYAVRTSNGITRFNLGDKGISNPASNAAKLTSVDQWGTARWDSMQDAFVRAKNMVYNATDIPDLSGVGSMGTMFQRATTFNGDISGWDVSNIRNMQGLFHHARSFNQDIVGWDVSSLMVVNSYTLRGATAFNRNQNLAPWFITQDAFTVVDGVAAGSVVGTIMQRSNLNSRRITYSISGGPDRAAFAITPAGELTIKESPDLSAKSSYTIEISSGVELTDGDSPSRTIVIVVR